MPSKKNAADSEPLMTCPEYFSTGKYVPSTDEEGRVVYSTSKGIPKCRTAHSTMQWRNALERVADTPWDGGTRKGLPKWQYLPGGFRCVCLASRSPGKCEGNEYPMWGGVIDDINKAFPNDYFSAFEIWHHVNDLTKEKLRPFILKPRSELGGNVSKLCYHV